LRDVPVIT